jgi:hypothetical protein
VFICSDQRTIKTAEKFPVEPKLETNHLDLSAAACEWTDTSQGEDRPAFQIEDGQALIRRFSHRSRAQQQPDWQWWRNSSVKTTALLCVDERNSNEWTSKTFNAITSDVSDSFGLPVSSHRRRWRRLRRMVAFTVLSYELNMRH